jgi:hypothetical protein
MTTMLRLRRRGLPVKQDNVGLYCVLHFPDSSERRWLDKLPTPGTRIRSHGGYDYWGETWVVDKVLQSGLDTYTIFIVGRSEYLDHLRNRPGFQPNLGAELLELARRTRETVTEQRRRWKRARTY